jgi:hypothetical protein
MGIFIHGSGHVSSDSSSDQGAQKVRVEVVHTYPDGKRIVSPWPDPWKFSIVSIEQVGGMSIVIAHYPDAKNFNGIKVLVFENTSPDEIRERVSLEPHFLDDSTANKGLVARFRPTEHGMWLARTFAKMKGEM